MTAIFVALVLGSPGCDTADLQAYCEEVSSCEGLNDQDTEACVVIEETREYIDSDIGCADEHVTYFDCLLEKGDCVTEPTGAPCQTSADCFGGECTTANVCQTKQFSLKDNDCKTEREAYRNCSIN